MDNRDIAARLLVLKQKLLVLISEVDDLFQEVLDTESVEE